MVLENTHTSTIAVYNSFTGDKIGTVPQSTKQDVLDALNLAKKGEAIGRKMPASKRIAILKIAVIIMEREFGIEYFFLNFFCSPRYLAAIIFSLIEKR